MTTLTLLAAITIAALAFLSRRDRRLTTIHGPLRGRVGQALRGAISYPAAEVAAIQHALVHDLYGRLQATWRQYRKLGAALAVALDELVTAKEGLKLSRRRLGTLTARAEKMPELLRAGSRWVLVAVLMCFVLEGDLLIPAFHFLGATPELLGIPVLPMIAAVCTATVLAVLCRASGHALRAACIPLAATVQRDVRASAPNPPLAYNHTARWVQLVVALFSIAAIAGLTLTTAQLRVAALDDRAAGSARTIGGGLLSIEPPSASFSTTAFVIISASISAAAIAVAFCEGPLAAAVRIQERAVAKARRRRERVLKRVHDLHARRATLARAMHTLRHQTGELMSLAKVQNLPEQITDEDVYSSPPAEPPFPEVDELDDLDDFDDGLASAPQSASDKPDGDEGGAVIPLPGTDPKAAGA